MSRSATVIVAVAAIALLSPSSAAGQSLLPPIPIVGGHGQRDDPQSHRQCASGITILCAGEKVVSTATGALGDVAGAGVGFAANAVLGGLVGWAANGAAWLLKAIGRQIDHSTRPALGSAWFSRRYGSMRGVALSLVLVFLLASIIHATARRDLGMLVRSTLIALPLGILLTFVAVTLAEIALSITDSLTAAALAGAGGDARDGLSDLAKVFAPTAITGPAIPGLVLFLGAILTSILALLVWIELVLREAAIYVALAFLPIALVAITWQRTGHWARRLTEWLVALILAKFTIAAAFGIAGAMLGEARRGSGGLSAMLGGCAVLLVAALSPYVLLRLIPFAEQAAGSFQRSHVGGALASVPGAAATTLLARQAMVRSFGASTASPAAGAAPNAWTPAPATPHQAQRPPSSSRDGAKSS